tara:strand:+ start:1883 stop:2083 length:201 start_codon:yes stop_codon:yes gene_type:complete
MDTLMPQSNPLPLRISTYLRQRVKDLVGPVAAALPEHRITEAAVLRMAVKRGVKALEAEYITDARG